MSATQAESLLETEIDAIGLHCPIPLLLLEKAIAKLRSGEHIKLLTSDPLSSIDIPHYCAQKGHFLIAQSRSGEVLTFLIEKREEAYKEK